ncbi:MAG: protein kinase [Planctomycetes bacterium]|nr:protein kinase [Planctomycetota bacterium]
MDDSAVVVSTDSRKTSTAPHQAAEYCQSVAQHIATIADAIAYAHEHGVIHRDIKPQNLILGRDGRVRVADFGLARLEEQPGVTVTGEFLGSPLYMSAEQITGGSANVDHRTDIYSLGATMYEWLTLAPPFPGKTREQVISKIVNAEPVPPRVHNPAIPVDLETICLRALARDRNRRYQTASAMRDDLHCYLAKRPIHARRDGAGTRAAKFARRHPFGTFAATTGATAAIIVATLGWALWTTRTEVRQQTAAAEAAKQETNEILDLVSSLPPEVALLFRGAEAIPPVVRGIMGSDEPAAKANNKPKRKGANAAAVRTAAGLARRGAVEFYADMAAAAGPGNTSISVPPESLRTAFDERATDPAHAKQLVDELLAANADDFDALQLHAVLLLDEHKYDAVAADAGLLVRLRPASFVGYLWRGLAGMLSGNTAASRDHFARAVELDANSAWAQTLYGLSATDVGLMDEAVACFDRALDLVPQLPVAILGRAVVYAATGQLDAAIAEVTRVLHQEPDNADAFAARGEYYSENGDYYNAARDISRAMELGGPTTALVAQYLALISRRGGPINPDVSDEEPSKTDEVEIGKVETETDSARNRESSGFTGLARAWLARMLPYRPERPVDTAGGHSQSLAPCDRFESRQTHVPLPSIRISRLFGSRQR